LFFFRADGIELAVSIPPDSCDFLVTDRDANASLTKFLRDQFTCAARLRAFQLRAGSLAAAAVCGSSKCTTFHDEPNCKPDRVIARGEHSRLPHVRSLRLALNGSGHPIP